MTTDRFGLGEQADRGPGTPPSYVAALRALVRRGYVPSPHVDADLRLLLPDAEPLSLPSAAAPPPALAARLDSLLHPEAMVIVLPTSVERRTHDEILALVERLVSQLHAARVEDPTVPWSDVLVVGLQWTTPSHRQSATRTLAQAVRRGQPDVPVLGLLVHGSGKVRTLDAVARLVASRVSALGWVDDDVELDRGCLAALRRDLMAQDPPAAVGAVKIPHLAGTTTSRLLAAAKRYAPSATSFPHGCAMIVSARLLADGIPPRYASDDQFVCLSLLQPDDHPLRRLRLVEAAHCHYTVAGPAGATRRRLRRNLISQAVLLADARWPVTRTYLERVMFPDLWPLTTRRVRRPLAAMLARSTLLGVYLCVFALVVTELAVRGLIRRPLRQIQWGSAGTPRPADADSRRPSVSPPQKGATHG